MIIEVDFKVYSKLLLQLYISSVTVVLPKNREVVITSKVSGSTEVNPQTERTEILRETGRQLLRNEFDSSLASNEIDRRQG